MTTRIHDMPIYATRSEQMDASLYNLWRRARLHLKLPLRLKLPALKSMCLILENDCWVVVDPRHDDLPLLAWVDFQGIGRSNLHQPVACTINYYHFMASAVRPKVLAEIGAELEAQLHNEKSSH
jgi:hypothetical protein